MTPTEAQISEAFVTSAAAGLATGLGILLFAVIVKIAKGVGRHSGDV